MKKIYKAPSTFSMDLHVTKMMMLNLSDQTIDSEHMGGFEQNAREDNNNTDDENNNRGSVWDNAW